MSFKLFPNYIIYRALRDHESFWVCTCNYINKIQYNCKCRVNVWDVTRISKYEVAFIVRREVSLYFYIFTNDLKQIC